MVHINTQWLMLHTHEFTYYQPLKDSNGSWSSLNLATSMERYPPWTRYNHSNKSSRLSTPAALSCMYDRHGKISLERNTLFGLTFGRTHHTTYSRAQSSIASQPPNVYRGTIWREWDLWGSNPILEQAPSPLELQPYHWRDHSVHLWHLQDTLPATSQGGATTYYFKLADHSQATPSRGRDRLETDSGTPMA